MPERLIGDASLDRRPRLVKDIVLVRGAPSQGNGSAEQRADKRSDPHFWTGRSEDRRCGRAIAMGTEVYKELPNDDMYQHDWSSLLERERDMGRIHSSQAMYG